MPISVIAANIGFARPEIVFDGSSPPPLIEEGMIWAISSGGKLGAFDASTGQDKWTVGLPGANGANGHHEHLMLDIG